MPIAAQPSRSSHSVKSKNADDAPGKRRQPTLLLQRAQIAPETLTSTDVLSLQRTIGNRATVGLLSRSSGLQAKLKLGPAGDKHEQEADRVADQVVRQMDPSQPVDTHVQRHADEDELAQMKPLHGAEGGEVESSVAQQIQSARGGGQPLSDGIRAKMERGFGANFSGVRVHTGGQADTLNRSLNARAFTVGNDVFFGKGQYNPSSSGGKKLIAHELTHTVQQTGGGVRRRFTKSPEMIQPLRQSLKDGKYYSEAAPMDNPNYEAEPTNDAFFTATSSGGLGGVHTSVFVEYFGKDNQPKTWQIDLAVGGIKSGSSAATGAVTSGSSGSTMESTGTGKGHGKITIDKEELVSGVATARMASKGAGLKKTWKRTSSDVTKAFDYVEKVKSEPQKFKYYLLGKGPSKLALNCARFGQKLLKAAGIPIHIGFWKLPSKITKQSKKDESIQSVLSLSDFQDRQVSELPEWARTQKSFEAKLGLKNGLETYVQSAGKMLERYHIYDDPIVRYHPLKAAVDFLIRLIQKVASERRVEPKEAFDMEGLILLRDEFGPSLRNEVMALKQQVQEYLNQGSNSLMPQSKALADLPILLDTLLKEWRVRYPLQALENNLPPQQEEKQKEGNDNQPNVGNEEKKPLREFQEVDESNLGFIDNHFLNFFDNLTTDGTITAETLQRWGLSGEKDQLLSLYNQASELGRQALEFRLKVSREAFLKALNGLLF